MDARTAEALEKSIEHWRSIVVGPLMETHLGPATCELCREFNPVVNKHIPFRDKCVGCPVYAHAGHTGCSSTPYDAAEDALYEYWSNMTSDNESAFRAAARQELAFLESLREEQ